MICVVCGSAVSQIQMQVGCELCGNKEFQTVAGADQNRESDAAYAASEKAILRRKREMDKMKVAPQLDGTIHKGMAAIGCQIYPPQKCRPIMSACWEILPSAVSNNERRGKSGIPIFNQIRYRAWCQCNENSE